jgi:hypothetical protein
VQVDEFKDAQSDLAIANFVDLYNTLRTSLTAEASVRLKIDKAGAVPLKFKQWVEEFRRLVTDGTVNQSD